MSHPDQETLVGLALGDEHDAALAAHVQDCAECRGEVDRTRTLLAGADQLTGGVELERPPAHVWTAVRAELDADDRPRVAARPRRRRGGSPRQQRSPASLSGSPRPSPSSPPERRRPHSLADARSHDGGSRGRDALLVRQHHHRHGRGGAPRRHPQARRGPLRHAEVQRRLRPDLAVRPEDQRHDRDRRDGPGLRELPDPGQRRPRHLHSVDISLEPLDGNPAHSATSLARGELRPELIRARFRQSETTTTEAAVPRTGTSVPTPGTCSGRSIGVTTRTTTVLAVVRDRVVEAREAAPDAAAREVVGDVAARSRPGRSRRARRARGCRPPRPGCRRSRPARRRRRPS